MAKFNARGIEGLELSMAEVAEIPDEIVEEMLTAAGEVVVAAQRREITALGLVKTGKLLGSLKAISKAGSSSNDFKRHVLVYPAGTHHKRRRRKVTKAYKRSKSGRTYTVGGDDKNVSSGEVGFILEFGAPKRGIKPRQWMKTANEKCAAAMVAAQLAVYDRWLKEKDL